VLRCSYPSPIKATPRRALASQNQLRDLTNLMPIIVLGFGASIDLPLYGYIVVPFKAQAEMDGRAEEDSRGRSSRRPICRPLSLSAYTLASGSSINGCHTSPITADGILTTELKHSFQSDWRKAFSP